MPFSDPALLAVEASLLAPGAPFELEDAVCFGEPMRVMKHRPRSLRAMLERTAAFGDAEYLVFEGEGRSFRCSYREHLSLVARTASLLSSRYGIGPGDHVAILGANAPEWIITFWAAQQLGAVVVAFNGWWAGEEIRWAIDHAEPKLLVADARRLGRLDGDAPCPTLRFEDLLGALPPTASELPTTELSEDAPALLLYTSGTSGRPKAVVHTHGNVCGSVMLSFFHGARVLALHPAPPGQTVVLITSPLFHVSGLHAGAITALGGGAKTVWPMGRFDPDAVARLIERERVSGWGYTPTLLRRLIRSKEALRSDLSSLRVIGGGGAPVSPDLAAEVRATLPQLTGTFSIGYGLTEGTAFGTLNAAEEWSLDPEGVGRPMPTIDVEIRDEEGRPLPEGEVGEVHLRSPLIMAGYHRDEEATRAAIRPGRWLRTGDIGALRGGRLYLTSRRTDLILRGGENLYPAEIEQRLEAHPKVAEAAVIGVPDEELGERVRAIVVPVPGQRPHTAELADFVRASLAAHKVPVEWELRTEPLPRNATGKVVRPALYEGQQNPFIEE